VAKESIEGLKELSKQLSELGKSVGSKALRSAAMYAAKATLDDAKASIPKGKKPHKTYKGRLVAPGFASRNLIRRSKLSKDKRNVRVSIGVKKEAYYALSFIELGTKHIPKRPWLSKAFEKNKNEMVSRLKSRLKKNIEKAVRK